MKVLFCTSDKIVARGIRGVTWSSWSHVGIIDGDKVIEAVWPLVRSVPLVDVLATHDRYVIVDIPVLDECAAIAFARKQIGKRYDWAGMIGLGLHRDWQQDTDWWCSELVAAAIHAGGYKVFRGAELHRITPQHLWMLNFKIVGGLAHQSLSEDSLIR